MVYLEPTYKQQLKCVKPTVKTVKQWSVNAVETLRGCFECTDWGVFKESTADIHEYTETVSDYITFCEGLCIPTTKDVVSLTVLMCLTEQRTQRS